MYKICLKISRLYLKFWTIAISYLVFQQSKLTHRMLICHHTDRPSATINYNLSTTTILSRDLITFQLGHIATASQVIARIIEIVLTNQRVPINEGKLTLRMLTWDHTDRPGATINPSKEIGIIINLQIQLTIQFKLTIEELKSCSWLHLFTSWHSWLLPKGRFCILFVFLYVFINFHFYLKTYAI